MAKELRDQLSQYFRSVDRPVEWQWDMVYIMCIISTTSVSLTFAELMHFVMLHHSLPEMQPFILDQLLDIITSLFVLVNNFLTYVDSAKAFDVFRTSPSA